MPRSMRQARESAAHVFPQVPPVCHKLAGAAVHQGGGVHGGGLVCQEGAVVGACLQQPGKGERGGNKGG